MFKRILVAIDGSPTARRGLKVALDLGAEQRAVVHAVHVVDDLGIVPTLDGAYIPATFIDGYTQALRDQGRKTLDKASMQARGAAVDFKASLVETKGRNVAQAILHEARKVKADLIVLGTHGRRGLRRVLLGSDAEAVVREAPVPVLLVRAGAGAPQRGSKVPRRRDQRAGGQHAESGGQRGAVEPARAQRHAPRFAQGASDRR